MKIIAEVNSAKLEESIGLKLNPKYSNNRTREKITNSDSLHK